FCGRKAHRVTTQDGTLFTIPCEAIFNQHPGVCRTALLGIGEPGRQHPILCVELEATDNRVDQDRLTKELLALGRANDLTKGVKSVLYHPAFPVDVRHTAKIVREKLAVWAAEQLR
ncbi:MAG: peptide synthase, partial [Phycisphaerae bacterium]